MKAASQHLSSADAHRRGLVRATLEKLLEELGEIEDGGLMLRLETSPQLEPIARPEVLLRENDRTYVCCCGWETQNVGELVAHLKRHGATRLAVRPENWKPS